MKEGYIIREQEKAHFITATVVDWIDVFTRKNYRDCIIDCLDFCIKNKGMTVYGYVIMSNHIHLIIHSKDGKLSDLIRDFKKFTAKTILKKFKQNLKVEGNGCWNDSKQPQNLIVVTKIISSGNMGIMLKKFIQKNLCGQNWIISI